MFCFIKYSLLFFFAAFAMSTQAQSKSFPTNKHIDKSMFLFDNIKYVITGKHTCKIGESNDVSGNIIIPDSVVHNGQTFYVTAIEDMAFLCCDELTSIILPNSITNIGVGAFTGCHGLQKIELPKKNCSIGGGAFKSCLALTEISIPNGIQYIESQTFYDCPSLGFVSLPDGVLTICADAFSGCQSLCQLTLPSSITIIGEQAFVNCTNLRSIAIPSSVTDIYKCAFLGCNCLEDIKCFAKIPPTLYGNYTFPRNSKIHVPRGYAKEYQQAAYWKEYNIVADI